jgi:hypothetical protein
MSGGNELLLVLLGGGLTVVGGFLGTAYLRWRDIRRENREVRDQLIAAIRIVRHELTRNGSYLHSVIVMQAPPTIDLTESNYRSVQLVLARHLPGTVRSAVAFSYTVLPTANDAFEVMRSTAGATSPLEALKKIQEYIEMANQLLFDHLTKELKAEA